MKKVTRFLLFVLTIATLLLSACGGAAPTATPDVGGGKVESLPVAFVGMVESVAGDQWVINGNTVTVSPDVIRDGLFNVGDQVKVEGLVNSDGSFTVSKVEVATSDDISTLPQFGADNSNSSNSNDANSNDANANEANGNDVNANDDNSNTANTNDDNGTNSNDDNGTDANSNDDNGNGTNSNDDNGTDGNSNDDNGNSDDSNSNDDNSNSGGGNDNGDGNNDNGGGNDDNGGGGDEDNSND